MLSRNASWALYVLRGWIPNLDCEVNEIFEVISKLCLEV